MAARRRNNSHARRTKPRTQGGTVAAWLRSPVDIPKGRRLRVLIYARYSTDEQNPSSIDDQVAYCQRFLESLGIQDAEITVLSDEGVSGELVSRPGINEVLAGATEGRWDLILCEDGSRLYRHETACGELIETAVDEGIRVILINDYMDTHDENWQDVLHEAMRHHAVSNRYTSRRIKRAHDGLWEMGAAVGSLKPGHLRKPTHPATEREPAKGPSFDEIHPQWAPVVQQAFEWIAAGDLPVAVAERLTNSGLPKTENSLLSHWTDKNVIALIRRTVYRGFDRFRDTVCEKKHRTGKRKQVRNDPDEVLTRDMPHLRIVSDHLWYLANDAIDGRISTPNRSSGSDHPLSNIPRSSRKPLSEILICSICKERTYVIGSNGYCCRNTAKRTRPEHVCWNRASTKLANAHSAIQDALRAEIQRLNEPPTQKSIFDSITQLLAGDEQTTTHRDNRRLQLRDEKQRLEAALNNLLDIAERGTLAKDSLAERIEVCEEKLARVSAELEDFDVESNVCLTGKEFVGRIEEFDERLQRFDRDVRDDLLQFVGTIKAVPHQQFGSDKIVLRGRFTFIPCELLPARVRLALQKLHGDRLPDLLPECLQPVAISVDLFELSTGPKHWKAALDLHEQGLGPTAIGKRLGISKRSACIARDYGRQLRQAGLNDPFIELTEPPATASRWGSRPRRSDSQSDR